MSEEMLAYYIPVMCAGIALFLVGLANLLLSRRSVAVRAAATGGVIGLALAGVATLDLPGAMVATARWLALGLVPFALFASDRLIARAAALVAILRRPAVRYGLLAASGLAVAIGAAVSFDRDEEAIAAKATDEVEQMINAPLLPQERAVATTDRGTPVALMQLASAPRSRNWSAADEHALRNELSGQAIRRGGGGEHTNCFGWVFAAGKFVVHGDSVETILTENGYHETHEPQPGDLVVYRQNGTVAHTAIVRYVTPGRPVLVEGKWGPLGVFLHPVKKSLYGTDFAYYRSERSGHVLVGLGGETPIAPTPDAE